LSDRKGSQLRLEIPSEDGDWLSSVQVGNLLELLPAIDTPKAREVFCSNLRRYLEDITNNNVAAFAEYIRCTPSILRNWLDGTTVPTLENLLRTCKCLRVSIVSLVASDGPSAADLQTAKAATAEAVKRDVAPFRNKSEIRRGLEKALADEVPRSLFKVARAMGYTSTERLYQADRGLCHKIAARYRQSGHSHWWKRPGATRICEISQMKQALERSLQLTEPLSVHHIAEELGYSNDAYVRKMFPDLCTTISKKLTAIKQARPLKIRIALKKALGEDPVPTLADLSRRLGYSTSTVLRAYEPHLCDQLASRNEGQARRHRANMERSARAFLKQTHVPSVHKVCERLGITVWFMTKYFPSVRRIIAEKRRQVNLNNARRVGDSNSFETPTTLPSRFPSKRIDLLRCHCP
jgi:AraC-like DNA-binding protein